MRTATRDILISLAVMLLGLAAAELAFRLSNLPAQFDAEELFASRLKQYRALAAPAQIVALGNSRVRHGLDTAVLGGLLGRELDRPMRSFNFGLGGVTGQVLLAQSLRLLDRTRPPEVVVFGLAPADFVSTTPPQLRHLVRSRLWELADLPALFEVSADAEELLAVASLRLSVSLRHRPRLRELVLSGQRPGAPLGPDQSGFTPEAPVDPSVQQARARVRAQGYRGELVGPEKRLSEFKLACLEQGISRLRAVGVRVVVVAMPAASPVNALAGEADSLVPVFVARIQALTTRWQIPFADLRAPAFLGDEHFTDGDHLNHTGARLLTEHLVRDWILPVLYGRGRPELSPPGRGGVSGEAALD